MPPIVHDVLRSSGRPLEAPVRAFVESRFAHDFGHVRVHTDAKANASAAAVDALAYTVGSHVVFGRGQYAPWSPSGKLVLAHELAHVVQQAGSAEPAGLTMGSPDDQLERQADAAARASIDGPRAAAVGSLVQPGVVGRMLARAIHRGSILDEGSCQHLACNSRFSCEDPDGVACPDKTRNATSKTQKNWRPLFTCDHDCSAGATCSDSDNWMAIPHGRFKTKKCNQGLVICANGKSTQGYVRDRSEREAWEVSHGIQDALGVAYGTFEGSIYGSETDPGFDDDSHCKAKPKPKPTPAPTKPRSDVEAESTDGEETV